MAFAGIFGCGACSVCAERWEDWRLRRFKLNGLMKKDRVGTPCPARQRGREFRAAASREAESGVGEAGTAETAGAGKFDPLSFAGGPAHDLGVVFSCPDRTFAKIGSERWQPKNSERTALI